MNIVIFVTAADKKEAGRIASALVKERLAACVNIIDGMSSIYWWQGKIETMTDEMDKALNRGGGQR